MAYFYILPTTDIHLVRDPSVTNGQQFILNFRFIANEDFKSNFLDVTDDKPELNLIDFIVQSSNINDVKIVINAKQVTGFTFLRIRYDDGEPDPDGNPIGEHFRECLVRVWIHEEIENIWINNNHLTICRGADFHGYVPSVFAKFTDSEIGDITYHPYLDYNEVNNGTNLIIDNHIIKAPNVTTEIPTSLTISVKGQSTLNDNVDVTIKAPFDEPRKILRKVHIGKEGPNVINLLILGDGFASYKDFKPYLDKAVKTLFGRILSPWNLLRENITIWAAFEPATYDKEGITINFPVATNGLYMPNGEGRGIKPANENELSLEKFIEEVGFPNDNTPKTYSEALNYWPQINGTNLKQSVFTDWVNYNTLDGYIENKDSALGVCIGARLGDSVKSRYTSANKLPATDWYYRSRQRLLGFDRRRYPEFCNYNSVDQHRLDMQIKITV